VAKPLKGTIELDIRDSVPDREAFFSDSCEAARRASLAVGVQ
jgi:hypothetical protein